MPKPSKVPLRVAESSEEPVSPSSSSVPTKATRRRFTAAEKLRIVSEADACRERGEIEALLRREGVYSSHLWAWRKALRLRGEDAFSTSKLGRPSTHDARDTLIARLERDKARLEKELELSTKLLDLQKKVAEVLHFDL